MDRTWQVWLRGLTSEYGMVVVLLLLCVYFSLATYKEQNPRGAEAGAELAQAIVRKHSRDVRVIVFARTTDEASQFAGALTRRLEELDAEILANVAGAPSEYRRVLVEAVTAGRRVDVVACDKTTARLKLLESLEENFAELAGTDVMFPESYFWPDFLKPANLRAVAKRIAVIAIIAIGMTMVIITAGIDLSVGSLIAFSAVTGTWMIRTYAGGPDATVTGMVTCSLIAILLCAGIGLFSGAMVTIFRIPAFIVTLSMMQVARGLAYVLSESQSIYQIPRSFVWLGRGSWLGIPNTVILMVLLYAVAHVIMTRTVLGRYIYAVGGNAEAARLSGVPVRGVLVLCYTTCAALAGVGGIILASELNSGAPDYGNMAELDVIAAVVVGGASLAGGEGRILGTLIGALIIGVMRNGMNLTNVDSNYQPVVLGLVILGAVLLDMLKKRDWSRWRRMLR